MTSSPSEFDKLANAILASGGHTSPSELHGFVCGVLAAGARPDRRRWQDELAQLLDQDAVPADLSAEFQRIAQESAEQLGDRNFDFQLLLAEDGGIAERTLSLGQWCQGFLHGFGVGAHRGELPPTSKEALEDLSAVSQVDADTVSEGEEAEHQLLEVQEFVRVAVMNIFTEAAPPPAGGSKGATLH
ncbi:UPF0149 family protein [Microbulbifer guangxiensis]|uniref:UPF0149 family protein n=1 Tax=Microbulbifer guangxiensis TaxID=2904249 RepID=UPI001F23175B|nr:UPF0149 family protein [Microbulbifer guangxiensis]